MASDRLGAVDRATIGLWRTLNAWGWGSVALVGGVVIHIALGAGVRSAIGSWEGATPVAVQLGLRVAGTVAIGALIGWIAAKRLDKRPWLTAAVVGAFYAFIALALLDLILGLPFRTVVEHLNDGTTGGTFTSIGMGRASAATRIAYGVITGATAAVAAVAALRSSRS